MSSELGRTLVEDFLKNSWVCVETIVNEAKNGELSERGKTAFFRFRNGQRVDSPVGGRHFFLRGSVEYSNPQLTVEEIQGIIATRLLEVCGNYFCSYGLRGINEKDVGEICEALAKADDGLIIGFLLNTDDTEPDRYSMNPLKESIVASGQSAFPVANVQTANLKIDQRFAQKYQGSLISKGETDLIEKHLHNCNGYMDMVDAVKYEQLENLSRAFGMNLSLRSLRMPLSVLREEAVDGLIHSIIKETHRDYESIERVYHYMGRSISKRTTLLIVPHSKKGYGSKRAARGKLYFDGVKLKNIKVDYQATSLYPNAIDPNDVSVAQADDHFTLEAEKIASYDFKETPSSPQFFLYALGSPEDAAIWHGIGAFGAAELLKSYATMRQACIKDSLIHDLKEKYGVSMKIPLPFNLLPNHIWFHPVHRNIDASVGSIENLADLARIGMRMEYLPASKFIRN